MVDVGLPGEKDELQKVIIQRASKGKSAEGGHPVI
jgi:hypothetical protein